MNRELIKKAIKENNEYMELERIELSARITRAEALLQGHLGIPLIPIQQEQLAWQIKYMKDYYNSLSERINMDTTTSSL